MRSEVRPGARAARTDGGGRHRECTAEETYDRVRPSFSRIGLTRVADITGLDRLGIPVYNAVVPRSADLASIYSGKGLRAADARTSAVMEAVERHVAARPMRPDTVVSYAELRAAGRPAMAPGDHSISVHRHYRDDRPIYWVTGWDLLSQEEVLVPYSAVAYGSVSGPPCHTLVSSNGLASGNTVEEAVRHALCEVIERDALTLAEVASAQLGHTLRHRHGGALLGAALDRVRQEHPHIDNDSLPPPARELARRFAEAGVPLNLVLLTSDIGVPTVLAVAREDNGPTAAQTHGGSGADPDVGTALVRAITECAQSRAVDVSATREDLELPGADVPAHRARHRRSSLVDDARWVWNPDAPRRGVRDLPSHPGDDVAADIRFMLDRLRAGGLRRVLVVDLSPPDIPVHVVRVLVPGLESWGSDRSKIGHRATRAWNRAVRALRADESPTLVGRAS
ncbi:MULTISPECIES: YcaO-like family protein [unclassified Micromonospora]|uniref:YcaO-like family protein n=1 Tax=unclassified Micromonospora TaxID=2617518 RepID=UPI003324E403